MSVCTFGELKKACDWMETNFDGTINVVHRTNRNRGIMPFRAEDVIPKGSCVVVQMQKPGYDARTIGKFRVTKTDHAESAPLETIGDCPPLGWVIMARLFMLDSCLTSTPCIH